MNKLNNDPSNLQVLTSREHNALHNINSVSADDRTVLEYTCVQCSSTFKPFISSLVKKHCSTKCSHAAAIKDKTLTKEILDVLIPTTSWVALGKMFGYSDNGIKKRAKMLGCVVPSRRKI